MNTDLVVTYASEIVKEVSTHATEEEALILSQELVATMNKLQEVVAAIQSTSKGGSVVPPTTAPPVIPNTPGVPNTPVIPNTPGVPNTPTQLSKQVEAPPHPHTVSTREQRALAYIQQRGEVTRASLQQFLFGGKAKPQSWAPQANKILRDLEGRGMLVSRLDPSHATRKIYRRAQ